MGVNEISGSVGVGSYTLKRVGQQPPAEGDNIVVEATISLPTDPPIVSTCPPTLRSDLQFRERLSVGGEFLTKTWGDYSVYNLEYRYRKQTFVSSTYAKAFKEAKQWCEYGLTQLKRCVEKREQALIDAEEE